VRNFNDSNIENKMKSFNIFWEIISVKLISGKFLSNCIEIHRSNKER
jgi:hypothetical protein